MRSPSIFFYYPWNDNRGKNFMPLTKLVNGYFHKWVSLILSLFLNNMTWIGWSMEHNCYKLLVHRIVILISLSIDEYNMNANKYKIHKQILTESDSGSAAAVPATNGSIRYSTTLQVKQTTCEYLSCFDYLFSY